MSLLRHAAGFLGQLKNKLFKSSQFQATRPRLPSAARASPLHLPDPKQTSINNKWRELDFETRKTIAEQRLKLLEADSGDQRLEHGIPNLSLPWRFTNLAAREQILYIRYGPNYATHEGLDPKDLKVIKKNERQRVYREARYRETLGPDWYTIYAAAVKLREGNNTSVLSASLKRRQDQLERDGARAEGKTEVDAELRRTQAKLRETYLAKQKWLETTGNLDSYIEQVQNQRAVADELDGK